LEVTQGASGDLQMVAQLSREMVTRFGFSSLGPQRLKELDLRCSWDVIGSVNGPVMPKQLVKQSMDKFELGQKRLGSCGVAVGIKA
jgi:hypothetical protein